jgi:hypothetical protein
MKQISKALITTLAISLFLPEVAQSRIIDGISPSTGAGLGDVLCSQVQTPVDTPFPNNDNSVSSSPNQILNFPGISCGLIFQAVAPIDTQLSLLPSGGTTEYFLAETVVNQTNSTWNGFSFSIGFSFGSGGNFVPPELIDVSPGFAIPVFDFNGSTSDPQPTSSKFTQLIQDGSFRIGWSGGLVAPGESIDFTFSVDVPDDEDGNNFSKVFTIRQAPIAEPIPEPDSTLGLVAGLGILGWRLNAKRKRF